MSDPLRGLRLGNSVDVSNDALSRITMTRTSTISRPRHDPGSGKQSSLPATLLFFAMASAAFSQDNPLTIESSAMQPSVLPGRPMVTWWDVKIRGPALVVGNFQFKVKSEYGALAVVETEELTLNGPEQRIRVVLPAVNRPRIDQLLVDISFHGKKLSGNLGQQILRVPFATRTVFVGLVGQSRTMEKRSAQHDRVLQMLKFENLVVKQKNSGSVDDDVEYVKTILSSLDTTSFPSDPLAYCGHDIVILMGDAFRNLRKPQVEALLAWIKSGGSLYLEPNGVLEPYHVDFLRGLTADGSQEIDVQVDPSGQLPSDLLPANQPGIVSKCGIGDAVVWVDRSERELDVDEWLSLIGPLWKRRCQPVELAPLKSIRSGSEGQPTSVTIAHPDPWGFSMAIAVPFQLSQWELLDRLMPENVRMVPLWLLVVILFAFISLIGPGEYFILGWFRARKLTWLTFPVATMCVTALTVWLSNSYMSSAKTRGTLEVRDLDRHGMIVRTNRFELMFVESSRRVTSEIDKGLFMALDTGPVAITNPALLNQTMAMRSDVNYSIMQSKDATGLVQQPIIDVHGRIPTQFAVNQNLSKWTPQLNRILTIPGTATSPDVDWSDFELAQSDAQVMRGHNVPPVLIDHAKTAFGPQAMVACVSGNNGWAFDREARWKLARGVADSAGFAALREKTNPLDSSTSDNDGPGTMEPDLFRWIYRASVAPIDKGTFRLTKQTAPKGSANCEDLPLFDKSNPQSWLLIIVVPENDILVVYRKLMQFRD